MPAACCFYTGIERSALLGKYVSPVLMTQSETEQAAWKKGSLALFNPNQHVEGSSTLNTSAIRVSPCNFFSKTSLGLAMTLVSSTRSTTSEKSPFFEL